MSPVLIFRNSQFGEIRTSSDEKENPFFCLTDLCRVLDLTNPSMVRSRLNEKGISTTDTLTSRGPQKLTYVDESNLYKVIFQSRKPEAESFIEWVTAEVLPSIRKHGIYASSDTIEKILADPTSAIKILTALENERIRNRQLEAEKNAQEKRLRIQEHEIQKAAPKLEYYDTVLQSESAIAITVIANELGVSAKYLNKFLVAKQIIRKVNEVYVLFAKYQGHGYDKPRTFHYTKSSGEVGTRVELYWTEKGRLMIHDLFKSLSSQS